MIDFPYLSNSEKLDFLEIKKVNIDKSEPIFKQRHAHSVYEFYVILRGNYVINVGSRDITVSGGKALLVAPGVYHMTPSASNDLLRVTISFKVDKDHEAVINKKLDAGIFACKVDDRLLALSKRVFNRDDNERFYQEELMSVVTLFLIELLRDIGISENTRQKNLEESLEDSRVRKIDAFFDKYLTEDVTSDMLAEELFISKRQLNRIMKRVYGLTFSQRLIVGRLDRAAWLLRTSDKSVSQISLEVGYESKSYFYRAFQAQYNMSPNEYRKKLRSGAEETDNINKKK